MTTPLQPLTGLPAGYPYDFERTITLGDGRTVHVRPVVPGDSALLAREVELADPETLYQRFFSPTVRLDEARLSYLTDLDYQERFALAAFAGGDGVAIARYEPTGEGAAEIAVVVKSAWRKVGLATELFRLLEEAAAQRGIHELVAFYLADNHAVERVLEKRGFAGTEIDGAVARVSKKLERY
jgi:RimJ/RimL family protein N-acetyltransferase